MTKQEILKKYFGYSTFRKGQEELIDSIMQGKDTVGVMPTGAGKSICYQVPAVMLEGITLVISPLISLMKDQVGALNQAGIRAAYLNSSLTSGQFRKALQLAREGTYKIVYVAPERLESEEFLDFALHINVSMLCIDEAHCISQWGQDFRPSYLKIVHFIEKLPQKPVISAFTATATKTVREDIVRILKLQEYTLLVTGFDRSNLYFAVKKPKNKFGFVEKYVEDNWEKSGVIYCATRKNVEEVCYRLQAVGLPVTKYHAGLSDEERKLNQEDFIYDRKPIMVATNAFGMGIDKSNVRYVLHYNMPKNIESYYQEAGRAGRDGETAECILLYGGQDVITNQFFIENNRDNGELDSETLELIKQQDRQRLKKMAFYCSTNGCLREYILNYFGEVSSNYCGNCSNCMTEFEEADVTEIAEIIVGCIKECDRAYGMNTIAQTLHGSSADIVKRYNLNENSFYGSLKNVSITHIRQVMNYLVLENVLYLSDNEYTVVKWNHEKVLCKPVIMKIATEKEQEDRKVKRKLQPEETEYDFQLFEFLRELRLEISKEAGAPPYIIFNDKTLKNLARSLPETKEQMLEVPGVGEVKFRRYGQRFLALIAEYKRR
ncbi:MAG: DNA helicase RecQ [Clostridiales bacterium]|nr:DNA helicase RecQ [Clostridiales bacterium]